MCQLLGIVVSKPRRIDRQTRQVKFFMIIAPLFKMVILFSESKQFRLQFLDDRGIWTASPQNNFRRQRTIFQKERRRTTVKFRKFL